MYTQGTRYFCLQLPAVACFQICMRLGLHGGCLQIELNMKRPNEPRMSRDRHGLPCLTRTRFAMIGNRWPCQAILQSEIDKALSPLNELFCAIRNVQRICYAGT